LKNWRKGISTKANPNDKEQRRESNMKEIIEFLENHVNGS